VTDTEAGRAREAGHTRCGRTLFHWGQRTYIMGIVNVSPDSFSGDGLDDIETAVALSLIHI